MRKIIGGAQGQSKGKRPKVIKSDQKRPKATMSCDNNEPVKLSTEEQSALKAKTQELYDEVDHNTIILFIAKRDQNDERVEEFKKKEEELMEKIKNNSDVCEIFMNLLIAEYKEMVYESIYFPYFYHDEYLHMEEMERIICEYYGEDTLYDHYHDPTHFMFDDGMHHYMFYEMVEKYDRCILDEEIYLNESITDDL